MPGSHQSSLLSRSESVSEWVSEWQALPMIRLGSDKKSEKSIFAKIAWFAKDLFTSGSSDLHKCFWNMSGLRRKTVYPVCLRPFCFVLLCSQIGNWEGGSGAGLFTGRLLLSAQQHPTSSHSVRQRLAGPFPPFLPVQQVGLADGWTLPRASRETALMCLLWQLNQINVRSDKWQVTSIDLCSS